MVFSLPTFTKKKKTPEILDTAPPFESRLTSDDYDLSDLPTPQSEMQIVSMVKERLRVSAISRRVHEGEWIMGTAWEIGNHYSEWRQTTNRMEMVRDPADPYRTYHICNYIRVLVEGLRQVATASKPDVIFKGYTVSPNDTGAAEDAEAINDDCNQRFDMQNEWLKWAFGCLATGPTFRKIWWNPELDALTWIMGKDGIPKVMDVKRGGAIDEMLVPAFEIYPDPSQRDDWDKCEYIIHQKLMPLDWFRQNFGERGYRVKTSGPGKLDAWWEAAIDMITGDDTATNERYKNQAYYIECWEKPTTRYPEGRMIQIGGDVLLTEPDAMDWPYEKKDTYPFIFLGYGERNDTLWSLNAVHDLIPPQRSLNQVMSRWIDRVIMERVTITTPRQSKAKPDTFQSRRNFNIVTHEAGFIPQMLIPPGISQGIPMAVDELTKEMEGIAGIKIQFSDDAPVPQMSGTALQIIRDESNKRISGFTTQIEHAAKKLAEWRLAIAAQYYTFPRYMAISNEDDPQASMQAAKDFRNIASGGRVRINVKDGSALPKSPAAQNQTILDLMHAGAFTMANLPITQFVLQLMEIPGADIFVKAIEKLVNHQLILQAQEANSPHALAEQQANSASGLLAQKGQQDVALEQEKRATIISGKQQDGIQKAQMIAQENEYELYQAELNKRNPPITFAIAGKAPGQLVISAAEAMGLDPGDVAEAEAVNAPPPKPAAPSK